MPTWGVWGNVVTVWSRFLVRMKHTVLTQTQISLILDSVFILFVHISPEMRWLRNSFIFVPPARSRWRFGSKWLERNIYEDRRFSQVFTKNEPVCSLKALPPHNWGSRWDMFTVIPTFSPSPRLFEGQKWSQTGLVCSVKHGSVYMQQLGALALLCIYSMNNRVKLKLQCSQSVGFYVGGAHATNSG